MTSLALSTGLISFLNPREELVVTGSDYGNGVAASAASACTKHCPA
jgi:hypothetical protein